MPLKTQCWILPKHPPVIVLLGRNGDGLLMLPAFLEIYKRTGLKPRIIVSKEYASIYDGVTYVETYIIEAHWYAGVPQAKELAQKLFGDSITPQWWHEKGKRPDEISVTGDNIITVQCHGIQHGVSLDTDPNFMASMWRRLGFTHQEMMTLPLVFDNRSDEREKSLVSRYKRGDKPVLLVNFTGISSPFKFSHQVMAVVNRFQDKFQIIDIGSIRCTRIYDLLGLYDIASGLITTDTATLHLAKGSTVPYVAFTVDGWCSSTPRGNVVKEIKYSETLRRLTEIDLVLKQWTEKPMKLKTQRTIHTFNDWHIGDNMLHLHFLRRMVAKYPDVNFIHACKEEYHPQLVEMIEDEKQRIRIIDLKWKQDSYTNFNWINSWKNCKNYFDLHHDRNSFCNFHIDWFKHLASKMGLESDIKTPDHLLFDYPAICKHENIPKFDYLVVNSRGGSGQFTPSQDDPDYFDPIIESLVKQGHSVICTQPSKTKIPCTVDLGLTCTGIGNLSLGVKNIIMVATGSAWATFNIWNRDTVKTRIVCLSNGERLDGLANNMVHVSSREEIAQVIQRWTFKETKL